MTEEEAKTKWCPQSFAPAFDGEPNPNFPGHMRHVRHGGLQTLCCGSACMAWRWEAKVDVWLIVKVRVNSRSEGFCGLAGKP